MAASLLAPVSVVFSVPLWYLFKLFSCFLNIQILPGFSGVTYSDFLLIHVSLKLAIGFLPSSFSMYAMSLSSGLLLLDKYAMAVAVSAVGVILGWPFSILAFLPVVIYSLVKRFKQAFISGAVTSIFLLVS